MPRGCLLLAVVVAGLVASASAHETWIVPSTFTTAVGEPVRLELTSGMEFPVPESPIRADRVARAGVRVGGEWEDLTPPEVGATSTVFRHTFPRAGLATVWLELKPRDIELTDGEVDEYLAEVGASADVRAAWARRRGRGAWKEIYTKYAKCFIAVGGSGEGRDWGVPIGRGLELVPEEDPRSLAAGGGSRVRLLSEGEPLAGISVALTVQGTQERVLVATDAEGRATLPLKHAGKALLSAVRLRPAADGSGWRSEFTTLTVTIRPVP